ncbi:MAG: hypothetical protein ACMG57_04215 [Candidatus Dojkabacteria bacterium]
MNFAIKDNMPTDETLRAMNGVLGVDREHFLGEFNAQAPALEKLFASKPNNFLAFMTVALTKRLIKPHDDSKQEGSILTLTNGEYSLNYEFILHEDGSVGVLQKLDYIALSTVIANKEITLKQLSLALSRLVQFGMHMVLVESKRNFEV